ncbi:MAG: hypothetical protein ACM359_07450 [Bacillota bacterium]
MMAQINTTSEPLPGPDLYCLTCGYNQRGIVADRCPECGQLYAQMPPSPVRLPWAHRRHMGCLSAYWRTVFMVLFRGKDLCAEMQHPVMYSDARRFWLFHIAWVYWPFLLATIAVYFIAGPQDREKTVLFTPLFAPIWPAFAINLGILLFIAAATGLPSYFCHPKRLAMEAQNRAITLSYYTATPLAATPAVIILLILSALAANSFPYVAGLLLAAGLLLTLLILGTWYAKTVALVATLAHRDRLPLAIWLPLLWLALAAWLLGLTPALVHYALLLIGSMG